MTQHQIVAEIRKCAPSIADPIRAYAGFVLRFRVLLEPVGRGKSLKFRPDYGTVHFTQMKGTVTGGNLIAPEAQADDDVRDRFASMGGGTSATAVSLEGEAGEHLILLT